MKKLEKELQKLAERQRELERELQRKNGDMEEAENEGKENMKLPKLRNVPQPAPVKLEGNLAENLEYFEKAWKNYSVASGLEEYPERVRVAVLLTVIGSDMHKVYVKLQRTDTEEETAEGVIEKLKENLTHKINKRFERFKFNIARQEETETYAQYFLRLKTLLKTCSFGEMEDELLLDKIICSIKNSKVQEKLWLRKNISLTEAIDICNSSEATEKQLKTVTQNEDEVLKIHKKIGQGSGYQYKKDDKRTMGRTCSYCGYAFHEKLDACPAREQVCSFCNIRGHFARVCYRRGKKQQVKAIEDQAQSGEEEQLLAIGGGKRVITVKLGVVQKDKKVVKREFQLDTGATCNVMGIEAAKKLTGSEELKLKKSQTRLKVFGGEIMIPRGAIGVDIVHKGKQYNLQFEVVEYDHVPILSAQACEDLDLIKVCQKIEASGGSENGEATKIVEEYNDIFQGIGRLEGEVELEVAADVTPVREAPRRIPLPCVALLKEELDQMVKDGIITEEPNLTEWVSNLTIVRKGDKIRVCLDPRRLNEALKDTKQQLPTVEEILPQLKNAKVFTTVDARKGFWQLALSTESSKLTTFWSPFGKYRFLRLPFGITTAMEIFQKRILELLTGIPGCAVIADDILIVGRGETRQEAMKDHNENLRRLFEKLRERGLKLNKEKLKLCKTEIKFFGHVLTEHGVKPDKEKVEAITNMPRPEDKGAVRRFLGMVTYLNRYIPRLADEAQILRELTKEAVEFRWTKAENDTFEKLKKIITEATTLKYYDVNKPVVIQTDASSFAVGAVLMQEGQPVAYASKTLSATQRNYAQIEREMLGIVYACHRFDQYICGKSDVMVETDHSPLVNIFKKPLLKVPKRLQCMILALQRYNISLKYTKGTEIVLADALSRAPESTRHVEKYHDIYEVEEILREIEEVSPRAEEQERMWEEGMPRGRITIDTLDRIAEASGKSDELKALRKKIIEGWPEKRTQAHETAPYWNYREDLVLDGALILKGKQIVIPKEMRREMRQKLHAGHQGIERTTRLAKELVYWPGMYGELEDTIRSGEVCQKHASNQRPREMMSHEIPKGPFERIGMDLFECIINQRKRHFLILVDHYSDYFEIEEMETLSAKATVQRCKKQFSRHGVPKVVVVDRGGNFDSQEFQTFGQNWGFEIKYCSPQHHQGNGKTEAGVKVAKKLIMKSAAAKEDFHKNLLVWRNTPNKTGYSPARRIFCRWLRCDLPAYDYKQKVIDQEDVRKKIEECREESKRYYDRKTAKRRDLEEGEEVYYKWKPEDREWENGKIEKAEGNRSYSILTERGTRIRRNERHIRPRGKAAQEDRQEEAPVEQGGTRRSTRTRRNPTYLNQYV